MEKVKNRFGVKSSEMYSSMVYKIWLNIRVNGFSQAMIAKDLGIDPANLSKLLSGVTEMSLGTFCALNLWLNDHVQESLTKYKSEYDKLCR